MRKLTLSGDVDTSSNERIFVWPDEDTSYMKLIWKFPTKKYKSGFHILGSRYHPVGDFDRPDVLLPDESLRIYETRNGFRVFFTGRYNVDLNSFFDEVDAMGGDPLYSRFARQRKYFAMRLEPKELPVPEPHAVTRFIEQTAPPLPEWQKLIDFHDQITNAHDPNAILV